MKMLLLVVLAVFTAASTLSAQDTLKVRSYTVVDLCKNERRWLLAVDLGKILPSDSLVSFDITIGYDRTKLRPTDVLKEGTLSVGMSYEPFLNTAVTNEMRIAAGNIVKTVSGDVPLVAIAGDFLGSCTDVGELSYPWPATFNSEFKRKFTLVRFDSVKATARPRLQPNRGFAFEDSSITIKEQDSTSSVAVVSIGQSELKRKQIVVLTFDTTSVQVSVDSISGLVLDSVITNRNQIRIFAKETTPTASVAISARWIGTALKPQTQITVQTVDGEDCSCEVSTLRDTVRITKEYPSVSVASADEHIEIITASNDALSIQCDHEEMKTVQFFDVLGSLVYQENVQPGKQYMSTSNLAKGVYHIHVACGQHHHATTILK
jgi:hypothetical protein